MQSHPLSQCRLAILVIQWSRWFLANLANLENPLFLGSLSDRWFLYFLANPWFPYLLESRCLLENPWFPENLFVLGFRYFRYHPTNLEVHLLLANLETLDCR
jgi:hypothetical protein